MVMDYKPFIAQDKCLSKYITNSACTTYWSPHVIPMQFNQIIQQIIYQMNYNNV